MMNYLLIMFIALFFHGCALNSPDGEKQLSVAINQSLIDSQRDRSMFEGRAKVILVKSYPRVEKGVIHLGHWVILQVGREKVSIDDYIRNVGE